MKVAEVRRAFLDFFKSKGHTEVQSSSLVPKDDPTLLFSNAGMNQFKNCFLGAEKRDYTRATTCQKSLRISGKHNDFENVGVTARHHTFFEMLGNFSFGDYFKKEAIAYAWEFSTKVLKLPISRIWVTIYEKDDEAFELWKSVTGIDPIRIVRLGESENFWAMGDTGPCGPCSELHYYKGADLNAQRPEDLARGSDQFLEFWNLVFMQFDRDKSGKLTSLPKPSIDTGMGLERVASIVQGVNANYDCDLFRSIIAEIEHVSGHNYEGTSYEVRDLKQDLNYARDVAMRAIADHARSSAFLVADGVHPGSDGRGYVLRRLVRRAIRHGKVLQFKDRFFAKIADSVITHMGDTYPELKERRDLVLRVLDAEEAKFNETLEAGLQVLQREIETLAPGAPLPGNVAFLLHDTYGFPLDLTEDALKSHKISVDHDGFNHAMEQQRERSREDRKTQGITYTAIKVDAPKTQFVGYKELEVEGKLLNAFNSSEEDNAAEVTLVFDRSPFYGESGGQVGDSGTITFKDLKLEVLDTKKTPEGHILHAAKIINGQGGNEWMAKLLGEKAKLSVDVARRELIRVNHTATHLVHAALRSVLGEHAKQAGSKVDESSLRFDYSHFEQVSDTQLLDIQQFVNEQVRANHQVVIEELPISEAKKKGAMALFGEKYGEVVRVVTVGPQSIEFCGGTHALRSGDIGMVLVEGEGGISAGVRRIQCSAGKGALAAVLNERKELAQISELLKGADDLGGRVEKLLSRIKLLERELEEVKQRAASASTGEFVDRARVSPKGVKVIVEQVESVDTDTLKSMVDRLRLQLGSGVVALASKQGEKATIVAGVTSDLASAINAGSLVKEAAKLAGGRGGGRADFAQAGGVDPALVSESLEKLFSLVQ